MLNSVAVPVDTVIADKVCEIIKKECGECEGHVQRCIVVVMSPLFNYMRCIGLLHYHKNPIVAKFLLIYNILIILMLVSIIFIITVLKLNI